MSYVVKVAKTLVSSTGYVLDLNQSEGVFLHTVITLNFVKLFHLYVQLFPDLLCTLEIYIQARDGLRC